MLRGIDRFPDDEFERYGITQERTTEIRGTMADWRTDLLKTLPDER
jgi:hypothetical protein